MQLLFVRILILSDYIHVVFSTKNAYYFSFVPVLATGTVIFAPAHFRLYTGTGTYPRLNIFANTLCSVN